MNIEKKKALQAIKTSRGQLEGIINMIEEGRYCMDINTQIMASIALLKKAQKLILKQHLDHCVLNALESDNQSDMEKKTEEISDLIEKLLR